MNDLCQTCWTAARPGDYFPESFRTGTCAACGEEYTFVGRVTRDEVAAVRAALIPVRVTASLALTGDEIAAVLARIADCERGSALHTAGIALIDAYRTL